MLILVSKCSTVSAKGTVNDVVAYTDNTNCLNRPTSDGAYTPVAQNALTVDEENNWADVSVDGKSILCFTAKDVNEIGLSLEDEQNSLSLLRHPKPIPLLVDVRAE